MRQAKRKYAKTGAEIPASYASGGEPVTSIFAAEEPVTPDPEQLPDPPVITRWFYGVGLLQLVVSPLILLLLIATRSGDAGAIYALMASFGGLISALMFYGAGFALHRLDIIARK
jgi:hypothetical protein